MSERYYCPDCKLKQIVWLKVFSRWWCSFCKMEKDTNETINEWRENGYNPKD